MRPQRLVNLTGASGTAACDARTPVILAGKPREATQSSPNPALSAAGIPSVLSYYDAGGAYPFDLTGGGARLLVDEADVEVAAADP